MLLEKLQEHKNFTAHEKDVAEYILSHLDQISELSVGELAKASYTSKATVVRLSQKLGLNGFQDLKITLTAEINQKKRIDQLLANEPVTAESTYDDIVKTLPALYDKAVTNTRLSLDKNSMKRISQVLQKAECIDIYGTGISYILAQSAAFKISTLGLECSAYESINSHYLAARKHKKNIAFLISLTGSNHTVICMAKYLREATETYVVGIAGPYHTLISEFTLMIREFSPLLAGAVVGFTWQILVIFGMHWGFIPVYINNVQTLGYDNVMMPFFACTFATSAVVLAMFFKTKDKKIKEMAIPNFISGIFGVTEPAIYGMLLPLKKPFIISCIAGGIGGAFYGHFNFRKFILGGMGIFELPNMINPDGTNGNIIVAFIGIAISMVVGFVLTMIFYHDEKTGKTGEIDMKKNREKEDKIGKIEKFDKNESDKIDRKERKTEKISSPLKGEVIALSDVQDEAFSSGALGLGAAVDPKEGVLYAPADGTISVFFPTGHAIGMTTDDGVELLIHVGMDTVQLEGKGFRPFAKEGDRVTKGQKLLEFDMELICKEGYSLVTPVLITNTDEFSDISITSECHIDPQSILMTVTR